MTPVLILISAVLIVITGITIMNVLIFPRLRREDPVEQQPLISILIPARNEANQIAETVRSHLAQTWTNFELLVLDDSSTDDTGQIAQEAGQNDPRLRVLQGVPLPEGWTGKNHACHVLSQHAKGDILVFTDADVRWQPDALNAIIAQMQQHNAGVVTVWSTQQTETLAERLVIPLVAFAVIGYLPSVLVHYTPFRIFAAANGQCMAWRKDVYERTGGHRAVQDNVLEDVTLSHLAKKHGARLWMMDGNELLTCRMYINWQSVRDGFAKNILAGYGNSVILLLLGALFHITVFLLPWLLLLTEYRLWAFLLIVLGIGVRALTAAFSHQRLPDALLLPVSVLLMTRIALHAIYWRFTGGVHWKGRVIKRNSKQNTLRSAAHG